MAERSGVRSITLTERLMNGTPRISMPSALRTDEREAVACHHVARAHLLALAGRGVVQVGDDAVGVLAEAGERAAIAQRHRRIRARRARQDRVEHELRAVRELLRAAVERLRLGDRRHRDAADLVAGEAGDEHVVERKVAREAPVLHLLRRCPSGGRTRPCGCRSRTSSRRRSRRRPARPACTARRASRDRARARGRPVRRRR